MGADEQVNTDDFPVIAFVFGHFTQYFGVQAVIPDNLVSGFGDERPVVAAGFGIAFQGLFYDLVGMAVFPENGLKGPRDGADKQGTKFLLCVVGHRCKGMATHKVSFTNLAA